MPMPPRAETAIGVDVGGTRIRAARIGSEGEVKGHVTEPVRPDREGFSEQLERLATTLQEESVVAVGIGLPGRVDGPAQKLVSAGFLGIAGLDVPALVREATGLPVRIENDATMALVAEARIRPDMSKGLIAMVTIGTGIGGALLRDGQPWYGGGFAGQFGHIVVAADGPLCNCGRCGCVETFSSGKALGRLLSEAGLPEAMGAHDLLDRAEAGDQLATALLEAWATPLARALQSLAAVANPKAIILGGGLGNAMTAALTRLPQASPWFPLCVGAARLGDDAGVIGAGLAALDARGARSWGVTG